MTATRLRTASLLLATCLIAPGRAHATACGGSTMACGTATSVTYGGTPLTLAGEAINGTVRTQIWYLKSPATGSQSVVVTAPAATDVTASSISFTGVDQTTPLGTLVTNISTAASTTPSVTANTILGEPVVDIMGAVGTTTPTVAGATQTLRNTNNTSSGVNHVVSGQSTAFGQAAPVTMAWTVPSTDWAIAAVPIKAATPLTGLEVDSFQAAWQDDGTLIQWRSGYQPKTVGFSVYRSNGSGPKTLLNRDLIPGGALAGTLSMFSWRDDTPGWNGDVSYWLAEVKSDGSRAWYGPASPVPPTVTAPLAVQPRDGGSDADAGGAGGGFGATGGSTGAPGSPSEVVTSTPRSGCAVVTNERPLTPLHLVLLAGVVWSARRQRRRWVLPLLLFAALLASGLPSPRRSAAAGGVSVDATATATGASGLTFTHVMDSGANRLLVVGVVTPVSCVDTTSDSGNCGGCGTTCALDVSSLSSGLIGLWHLDEGTGASSADASGSGHAATLLGAPAWTTGYEGKAIQGNGTSSYAQAYIGTWFGGNNPLTAAAWVYVTANTNGPVFGVSAIPAGGTWNMPFLSIQGGASTSTVYGYVWQNTPIPATVSNDAWHLVALTYNPSGSVTTLYVDGVAAGTGTGTYQPSGLADYWTTYISGAKPTGVNSYLLGRVDEVRAYNRVLSGVEMSALYTARLACGGSTCAACGSGKTSCSGSCVTTANDDLNCGSCGHACNTANGETCSAGTCTCANVALSDCSSYCVDETSDTNNCGACGNVCGFSTPTFVDSGLLGRWKLDEGTGTTSADATGNGRTATLTGSPTWGPGYSGQGLTFDGTNYLNATLGTWFGGNNPLTASAWVYATSSTNGPIFGVCDGPPGAGWNMPFLSIIGGTSTSTVYGYVWQNTPLPATVSNGAWHLLTLTYDPASGGTTSFYVDGALANSGTGTYQSSGNSDTWTTYITGAKPVGVGSLLMGEIDDVRAYSRVLSAAEIAILYNARQSCSASVCGGCGGGETVCGTSCTNKAVDPDNCGACGTTCNKAGGETCVSSTCGCATGTDCSGTCTDTVTDNLNCGMCGNACGTTTCASCSQGLLGLWHLDEGTGTTSADASGNNNTATLTNGPTWTTSGESGDALVFAGTNDYLSAPIGTWFGLNATLTASVWVYATSTTNGPVFGVTDAPGGGTWDMPFLSVNGANVYGWLWQVNGNTPLSATVSLNAWHLLAITYDPAVGEKFYVDGALSSSATGTFLPSGRTDYWTTYIPGAKPAGVNDHFSGKLDEARAFNRVLSAGEIKLLYDTRQSCAGSACNNCPSGTTLCGSVCTNTQADKNNCNACGTICPGAQTCVSGTCM